MKRRFHPIGAAPLVHDAKLPGPGASGAELISCSDGGNVMMRGLDDKAGLWLLGRDGAHKPRQATREL